MRKSKSVKHFHYFFRGCSADMKWTLSGKTLFLNCDSWSKTVHGFAYMFGQMIVISLYNFLLFLFVRPVELFEMNIWRLPRCVIINFSSAYDGNQKSRTKNSKSWICMTFSVKKKTKAIHLKALQELSNWILFFNLCFPLHCTCVYYRHILHWLHLLFWCWSLPSLSASHIS